MDHGDNSDKSLYMQNCVHNVAQKVADTLFTQADYHKKGECHHNTISSHVETDTFLVVLMFWVE